MSGVRSRLWRDGEVVAEDFPLDDLDAHLADPSALVWLDLCQPEPALLNGLARELCLDPHAVEDAVAPHERPKATRHRTHTFITLYAIAIAAPAADPLESRISASRVSAFLLPRGLVTVRPDGRFTMDEVVRQWDDNPDVLADGVPALLHGLLDVVVDGYFDVVQHMDDAIESIEDLLFDQHTSTRTVQQRVYRLRKELVEIRRVILPMREVVNTVGRHRGEESRLSPALEGAYDDLYDHVLRASEWTESLRDMVSTVFETNLSLQDARLNEVMKKLAAWAAIIAVPTAVTGWFGQNVPYPGFSQATGLMQSVVLMVIGTVGLYVAFRRNDWL